MVMIAVLGFLVIMDLEDLGAMARKGRGKGKGKKCCPAKKAKKCCPGKKVSWWNLKQESNPPPPSRIKTTKSEA